MDEEIKNLIGEPNEYLKNNNYCDNYCDNYYDCDNYNHCFNIAHEEFNKKFEITCLSLYENGLDHLFCKKCYIEYFKKEPQIQTL